MPPQSVLNEIDRKVDMVELERVLMEEGTEKFAEPQKALLRRIAASDLCPHPRINEIQGYCGPHK